MSTPTSNHRIAPTNGLGRRSFLGLGAAGAAAGTVAAIGTSERASASGKTFAARSAPKPLVAAVDTTPPGGEPAPDPFRLIHWLLPGPAGAATQVLGLPAFGLDVDPSTITDFDGFIAYAVVAGNATGGDGESYDCEFDVRAMQGRYVGEDGVTRNGTFAFF